MSLTVQTEHVPALFQAARDEARAAAVHALRMCDETTLYDCASLLDAEEPTPAELRFTARLARFHGNVRCQRAANACEAAADAFELIDHCETELPFPDERHAVYTHLLANVANASRSAAQVEALAKGTPTHVRKRRAGV